MTRTVSQTINLYTPDQTSTYITYISAEGGIKVHNANDSSNYLQLNSTAVSMFKGGTEKIRLEAENLRLGDDSEYVNINSNGLEIFKENTSIANFGDTVRIGSPGSGTRKNYVEINKSLFQMRHSVNDWGIFLQFIDFRDEEGYALIKRKFIWDREAQGANRIPLGISADRTKDYIIKINDVVISDRSIASIGGDNYVYVYNDSENISDGDSIYVEYYTDSTDAKAYTFGKREANAPLDSAPGAQSFVIGRSSVASGYWGFSHGQNCEAGGNNSFSTGWYAKANGSDSFAAGHNVQVKHQYSAAIGSDLETTAGNQLICGSKNDTSEKTAQSARFIVGNNNGSEATNLMWVSPVGGVWGTGFSIKSSNLNSYGGSGYAMWCSATYNGVNYFYLVKSGSSIRYKENISPVIDEDLDPHKLYSLPARQFQYKEKYYNPGDATHLKPPLQIGFIAEEVEKYYPAACLKVKGEAEDWDMRAIIPAMLSLIQEQHEQIEDLTNRIEALENK